MTARRIVIRRARVADAAVLSALCRAHAAFEQIAAPPHDHVARLCAALRRRALMVWLVLVDGQAGGYLSATEDFATLSGQRYVHMDCLYLCPDMRGRGLGARLMARACTFARRRACASVQWQTPDWNLAAIRFYERLGVRPLSKARFMLPLNGAIKGAAAFV